jgi:uncharacterized protein with von Willebrand factor type A (vWA) domain
VDTEWIMKNLDSDYRVIIVGDASMAPDELLYAKGNIFWGVDNEIAGIEWLKKMREKYHNSIWLNPIKKDEWKYSIGAYTIKAIKDIFPMFDLTLNGIDEGIKKLKTR